MRSKTSYFNTTLFWKTVTRFWPIWFAYAFTWVIALPVALGSELSNAFRVVDNLPNMLYALQDLPLEMATSGGIAISAVFCCLAAMAAYSHLYSARSADAFASLPIKREGTFLSVTLAGLLPMLIIHILVFFIAILVEAAYSCLYLPPLLQWLAVVTMLTLFFFGFAAFCAQLTGSLLVLPFLYTVLNFTAYVVESLIMLILRVFVFGYATGSFTFSFLSPIIFLYEKCTVQSTRVYNAVQDYAEITGYYLTGWGCIIGYAAVGLLFIIGSLLLYKNRRMETAGDVVAVRSLKPVFKYCLAMGCALCIGTLLFTIIFSSYRYNGLPVYVLALSVFMIIGCFIGYFAAEMLIHKSFAVWRGRRRWLGFFVASAVIIVLTFSCEFDLFGYEKRIPAADEIETVTIRTNGDDTELVLPQNIEAAVNLHESIIGNKSYHETGDDYGCYLALDYTLKNGSTIERSYELMYHPDSKTGDVRTLQDLVNCQEAIDFRKDLDCDLTITNIDYANIRWDQPSQSESDTTEYHNIDLTANEAYALYYDCILPDIQDGTLGRIWLITDEDYLNTVYDCTINIECSTRNADASYEREDFYTVPTIDSKRTNAWLAEHGVELHTEGEFSRYSD